MASMYELLLAAMRDARPGMAPDDPADIAGRYPESSVPDYPYAEAQLRVSQLASNLLQRDPNFRQLSRAPFAAQAQAPDGSSLLSNSPDYLWTAPLQNAESARAYGDRSTLRWAPIPPPMLPVRAGRFPLPGAGGLGGPTPLPRPGSTSKIPMPEIPEAWKILGPILMLYPELVREGLLGERAPDQILEVHQKRRRGAGSKTERPATIQNGPSVVPDADADVSASADDRDWCQRRYDEELKKCWENFPRSKYGECRDRATRRWDGCNKSFKNTGGPPIDELKEYDGYPD